MRKLLVLPVFFILCSGCLDLAPKADKLADVKAQVDTKVEAKMLEMNNKVEASGNRVDAKLISMTADLDAKVNMTGSDVTAKLIDMNNRMEANGNALTAKLVDMQLKFQESVTQTIGTINGPNNAGMFSGGAAYVTAVCITLILSLIGLAAYLFRQKQTYQKAYHAYSEAFEEQNKVTRVRSTDNPFMTANEKLEAKLVALGLRNFIVNDLANRGILKRPD